MQARGRTDEFLPAISARRRGRRGPGPHFWSHEPAALPRGPSRAPDAAASSANQPSRRATTRRPAWPLADKLGHAGASAPNTRASTKTRVGQTFTSDMLAPAGGHQGIRDDVRRAFHIGRFRARGSVLRREPSSSSLDDLPRVLAAGIRPFPSVCVALVTGKIPRPRAGLTTNERPRSRPAAARPPAEPGPHHYPRAPLHDGQPRS